MFLNLLTFDCIFSNKYIESNEKDSLILILQSTPLNRVTLVPKHFDPIKRNLGVDPIKWSELILFLWFRSWPSDPIKRSRLYMGLITYEYSIYT